MDNELVLGVAITLVVCLCGLEWVTGIRRRWLENGLGYNVYVHYTCNYRDHGGLYPCSFKYKKKVPFLQCPLYIKKGVFLRLKRHGFIKPKVPFLSPCEGERVFNDDYWTSEVPIPVNFPHCFLRL